ncbi:hypothetical protein IE53DRAFT_387029 [Violaceomyces palustris]|uniref:Uncharacterized protein n=1 Tax=Violaceomyces palustris TaxID=1673888 RepID=A0ACD0NY56_9BASI|nr:hypothetical protein IE53DRAFT_387029 [Violaceomyces palustris]
MPSPASSPNHHAHPSSPSPPSHYPHPHRHRQYHLQEQQPSQHPLQKPSQPSRLANWTNFARHQPIFPSPLSQQPLRASASSSITQASNSSSTATSRFSISQAFSSLTPRDIAFFDSVISLLGPGASDFAQLKKAYNASLSSNLEARANESPSQKAEREEWDAHLWSILLSLVRVRGKDWSERWDSVRMAMGLDPRSSEGESTSSNLGSSSSSSDSQTSGTDADEDDDDHDDDEGEAGGERAEGRGEGRGEGRYTFSDENDSDSLRKANFRERRNPSRSRLAGMAESWGRKAEMQAGNPPNGNVKQNNLRAHRLAALDNEETPTESSAPESISPASRNSNMNGPRGPRAMGDARPRSQDYSTPKSRHGQSDAYAPAFPSSVRRLHGGAAASANGAEEDAKWIDRLPNETEAMLGTPRSAQRKIRMLFPDSSDTDENRPSITRSRAETRQAAEEIGENVGNSQSRDGAFGSLSGRIDSDEDSTPKRPLLPVSVQRRFHEVVRNSLAEREAQREAEARRKEEKEAKKWLAASLIADKQFANNLLKTCFTWWVTLASRRLDLVKTAEETRSQILLVRSFDTWKKSALARVSLAQRSVRVDEVRCKLGAWRRWRRITQSHIEKRKESKVAALRFAYHEVASARRQRILRQAFEAWRCDHLERRAKSVRRKHLLQGSFALWQLLWARADRLHEIERELFRRRQLESMALTLRHWAKRLDLRRVERDFELKLDKRRLKDAFDWWNDASMLSGLASAFSRRRLLNAALIGWTEARRQCVEQRRREALADRWRARRIKRKSFGQWLEKLEEVEGLEAKGDSFVLTRDRSRLDQALGIWMRRERELLLTRVREARSLERNFRQWYGKLISVTLGLKGREDEVSKLRSYRLLGNAFRTWTEKTRVITSAKALAVERDARASKERYLERWISEYKRRSLSLRQSEVIADFFALRHHWAIWTERFRQAKAQRIISTKEDSIFKRSFAMWRVRLSEKRREDSAVTSLQSKSAKRIKKAAFSAWLERVIERRNRELQTTEDRNKKLVHNAFYVWVEACLRHDDILNLMQSYRDVKQEEMLRRIFVNWLAAMRARRSRRERAERLIAERRSELLAKAWQAWRDRYVEAILRPLEFEAMVRRQDYAIGRILDKWKARTKALPAIQFRNARIKSKAIRTWKKALPGARMLRNSKEYETRTLLTKAFSHWCLVLKTRHQLQAAARFGGASMSRLRTLNARFGASSSPRSFGSRARLMSSPGSSSPRDLKDLVGSNRRKSIAREVISDPTTSDVDSSPEKRDSGRRRKAQVANAAPTLAELTSKETFSDAGEMKQSPREPNPFIHQVDHQEQSREPRSTLATPSYPDPYSKVPSQAKIDSENEGTGRLERSEKGHFGSKMESSTLKNGSPFFKSLKQMDKSRRGETLNRRKFVRDLSPSSAPPSFLKGDGVDEDWEQGEGGRTKTKGSGERVTIGKEEEEEKEGSFSCSESEGEPTKIRSKSRLVSDRRVAENGHKRGMAYLGRARSEAALDNLTISSDRDDANVLTVGDPKEKSEAKRKGKGEDMDLKEDMLEILRARRRGRLPI